MSTNATHEIAVINYDQEILMVRLKGPGFFFVSYRVFRVVWEFSIFSLRFRNKHNRVANKTPPIGCPLQVLKMQQLIEEVKQLVPIWTVPAGCRGFFRCTGWILYP